MPSWNIVTGNMLALLPLLKRFPSNAHQNYLITELSKGFAKWDSAFYLDLYVHLISSFSKFDHVERALKSILAAGPSVFPFWWCHLPRWPSKPHKSSTYLYHLIWTDFSVPSLAGAALCSR
jgi:hypothetical protein